MAVKQTESLGLDDGSDFEEPLEIPDLAGSHGQKDDGFEDSPQHDAAIRVLVD